MSTKSIPLADSFCGDLKLFIKCHDASGQMAPVKHPLPPPLCRALLSFIGLELPTVSMLQGHICVREFACTTQASVCLH